jgi:hypothetical protein
VTDKEKAAPGEPRAVIEGPPDNTLDGLPPEDPIMTGEAAREAAAPPAAPKDTKK